MLYNPRIYKGHCYSKREEAAWPILFLNNNDPIFLHPVFCKKAGFPDFLKVPDPKKILLSARTSSLLSTTKGHLISKENFREL